LFVCGAVRVHAGRWCVESCTAHSRAPAGESTLTPVSRKPSRRRHPRPSSPDAWQVPASGPPTPSHPRVLAMPTCGVRLSHLPIKHTDFVRYVASPVNPWAPWAVSRCCAISCI